MAQRKNLAVIAVLTVTATPLLASAQVAGSDPAPTIPTPPISKAVSDCPNNPTAQAAGQAAANAQAAQANAQMAMVHAAITPGAELMACLDRLAKLSTTLNTPDWGALLTAIENQIVGAVCSMADMQWQNTVGQINQAAMLNVPVPGVGVVTAGGAQVMQGSQQGYTPSINQQPVQPAGATSGVMGYLNGLFKP